MRAGSSRVSRGSSTRTGRPERPRGSGTRTAAGRRGRERPIPRRGSAGRARCPGTRDSAASRSLCSRLHDTVCKITKERAPLLVAIDIGGTFTDLMAFDETTGRLSQAKTLTTPARLVQGIVDCLKKSGVDCAAITELIHGSTTAINTLIERKGAKTGLIVTRGTRDVYCIGRGNRPESYNLFFHRHRPLVPRQLTREIDERVLGSGEVLEPLRSASVEEACRRLAEEKVEAV